MWLPPILWFLYFVFLFLSETYNAILIGFLIWMGFMFPRTLYMVKPDAYEKCAIVKDILCFNANSFWFWERMPLIGLCIAPAFLLIAFGFVCVGARRLERADI